MRCCTILSTFALLCCFVPAQRNGGPIRPGPWTKAKIPPGWVVHDTRNYQIQSEVSIEKAQRLGEHMEVMNKVYRRMFRPDKAGSKQQTIKLFKDIDSFHGYGAPQGAAAYYSSGDREMVCYDTGKWSDAGTPEVAITGGQETPAQRRARILERLGDSMKMDILGCAAHEGWHQYFDWYVGSQVGLPSWINEGMGDYFYAAAPREVKGKQVPAELGRMNGSRLGVLMAAERQDVIVPLDKFVMMMQSEYYTNPGLCYSQGWGLCQFLLHTDNPKYNKIIPTYIRLVRDDTNMAAVTERAFKGVDWVEMEKEFKAWIRTLKPDISLKDLLDEEPPAAKPDAGGEAPPAPAGGTPGTGAPGTGTPGTGTPGTGTPGTGTPGSGAPGSGAPGSSGG